jgi:Pilus assembly protein, PilO
MSKVPNAAKAGILVVGLLVALAAGWFVVIAPKRSEAAKIGRQIDDTRALIAAAQTGGSGSEAQPIRIADLFELSRAMPDRADIPSVLLQLSEISGETGVTFQSITPHDPVQLGPYQQISIELVFEGHFYDLSDFLYRLRNLVGVHQGVLDSTGRLFSVDSIAFDEGELKFPEVKATLTVSAYVFGDGTLTIAPTAPQSSSEEAAPAAASTGSGAPAVPTPARVTPSPAGESDTRPIPVKPPKAKRAGA